MSPHRSRFPPHSAGAWPAAAVGETDPREDRAVRAPAASHPTTGTRSSLPDPQHAARHAAGRRRAGKVVAELATSDLTKFDKLGLKTVEMFTYLAADGKTELCGLISFPSNFDPPRKYPALASVYGGPALRRRARARRSRPRAR